MTFTVDMGEAFHYVQERNTKSTGISKVQLAKIGLENNFVITIPARDILSFCDSENKEGIKELREICNRLWNNPEADHLLSNSLYIRENGKWVKHKW